MSETTTPTNMMSLPPGCTFFFQNFDNFSFPDFFSPPRYRSSCNCNPICGKSRYRVKCESDLSNFENLDLKIFSQSKWTCQSRRPGLIIVLSWAIVRECRRPRMISRIACFNRCVFDGFVIWGTSSIRDILVRNRIISMNKCHLGLDACH